jgi:hypothetical protein
MDSLIFELVAACVQWAAVIALCLLAPWLTWTAWCVWRIARAVEDVLNPEGSKKSAEPPPVQSSRKDWGFLNQGQRGDLR